MRFLIQLAFLTGFFVLGFLFAHEPFRKALFEPLRDAVPQATDVIEKFHRDQARARTERREEPKGPRAAPPAERAEPARTAVPAKPARKETARNSASARKGAAPAKTPKGGPAEKQSGQAPRQSTQTARNSDHLTEGDRHQLDNLLDDVAAR